jgi:hypothetical protein
VERRGKHGRGGEEKRKGQLMEVRVEEAMKGVGGLERKG